MIDVMLNYDEGLNPYYGLVDIALKYEIFKKVSTRIEMPDGTKVYEKSVYKDPEKYFTKENQTIQKRYLCYLVLLGPSYK